MIVAGRFFRYLFFAQQQLRVRPRRTITDSHMTSVSPVLPKKQQCTKHLKEPLIPTKPDETVEPVIRCLGRTWRTAREREPPPVARETEVGIEPPAIATNTPDEGSNVYYPSSLRITLLKQRTQLQY